MVRMFVRHRVSDFTAWKRAYDEFDAHRRSMGVIGAAVFQAHDDPEDVTVWHDFENIGAAQTFASSVRLREVMQAAGVTGQPTIWFAKQA